MRDLLVSYDAAVAEEIRCADANPPLDEQWGAARLRMLVARARLVYAIENLEAANRIHRDD